MKRLPRLLPIALAALFAGCATPPASRPVLEVAHIGFGSCLKQDRPAPVLGTVAARQPDLFLFLGDNLYADTRDMRKMAGDYRELGNHPGFQQLRKQCPLLATWDDHDYGENDAGAEYPMKAEAARLLLDFFDVPDDSPRRTREGIYGEERLRLAGLDVQILLLDTRTFRSPLVKKVPPPDRGGPYVASPHASATILGDAQWAWLEARLREPADLRLLASSIQVVPEEHHWEKWMNFPGEQARLFALIRETGATGVVVLSGDRHHAEISQRDDAVGYPLIEVTASSFNNPVGLVRDPEPNRYRHGTWYEAPNAGWITVRNFGTDPEIQFEILEETGRAVLSHTVRLSRLRP